MLVPALLAALCLPQERPTILGPPLVVGGERIPDEEIERYLVYGPGRTYFEALLYDAMVDAELARRARTGVDVSGLEVTDADVEERLEAFRAHTRSIGLEVDGQARRLYGSADGFEVWTRAALRFDRVFLPPDPNLWPPETNEVFRSRLGDCWPKWHAEQRDVYLENCRPWLRDPQRYLRDWLYAPFAERYGIATAVEGLPPGEILRVDGRTYRTEEVFTTVASDLSTHEVEVTKRWLAVLEAARQVLEAQHVWLANDEVTELIGTRELDEERFDRLFLGSWHHGHPSLETYARTMRVQCSFEQFVRDRIARSPKDPSGLPAVLADQLPRTDASIGISCVDARFLVCSAFDWPAHRWKENGWTSAKSRADALMQRLRADPGSFERLREEHCELWDPPAGAMGRMLRPYLMNGRAGSKARADLARWLGEGPFWDVTFGESITDRVFFDQEVGTIEGPWRGPYGYYIVHLLGRSEPRHPLDLTNEKHYALLVQDYVREAFVRFVAETFAETEVSGLEPGHR